MPVRACPDRRKVITATDEQNGMKGHDEGTKNQQRREERVKEATHHRGEAQHTKKHTNKN